MKKLPEFVLGTFSTVGLVVPQGTVPVAITRPAPWDACTVRAPEFVLVALVPCNSARQRNMADIAPCRNCDPPAPS